MLYQNTVILRMLSVLFLFCIAGVVSSAMSFYQLFCLVCIVFVVRCYLLGIVIVRCYVLFVPMICCFV